MSQLSHQLTPSLVAVLEQVAEGGSSAALHSGDPAQKLQEFVARQFRAQQHHTSCGTAQNHVPEDAGTEQMKLI